MSRIVACILSLCALTLAPPHSPVLGQDNSLQIGGSAPAFIIDTLDGTSVTNDFHARPAYINVFATWCGPCQREFPTILQLAKQYRERITFLFIDEQEPPVRVKSFARAYDVAMPIAVDRGQFAATFNVQGLPESIFIDRSGIVRFIYRGTIPDSVLSGQLATLASDSSTSVPAR